MCNSRLGLHKLLAFYKRLGHVEGTMAQQLFVYNLRALKLYVSLDRSAQLVYAGQVLWSKI